MTTNIEFEFLNMKTHFLKVHVNCQGCVQKVRKLLRKIQGVYGVNIDAEQQKITVMGNVESATLIKRLIRAGKHAELWPPSFDVATENQHLLPTLLGSEFGQNIMDGNGNAIGAGHGNLQDNVFPMMGSSNFHGNGAGHCGLQGLDLGGLQDFSAGYGYGHLPPVMLTNPQGQGYPHTNYAPPAAFRIPTNVETAPPPLYY